MKLNKIIEVADALSLLATTFREAEVDTKALSALSALDEGVYENLIIISEALGLNVPNKSKESQTVDTQTVEETETEETTEAFSRKRVVGFTAPEPEPEPVEVVAEGKCEEKANDFIIVKDDEITPPDKIAEEIIPGYFTTKYPNVLISRDGRVIYRKNHESGWSPMNTFKDANGSARVRIRRADESFGFTISRLMLETFVGVPTENIKSCDAGYKDGDETNLNIENLMWLRHNESLDGCFADEVWHEACKIGVEMLKQDPSIPMSRIGKAVHERNIMGVTSWMTMYKRQPEIFNQYFRKEGRRVFLRETTVEPIEMKILTIADKAKQISETRSYISGKGILKDNDKVLPILTCIKNTTGHLDSTANIMSKINKRYGKLYISQKLVDEVKAKKIRKDLCDLVF